MRRTHHRRHRAMSALLCGVVLLQSMPAPLLFAQSPAGEGAVCAGSPLPVDLRSGELLLVAPDLKVGLGPLSLEITRVYRSNMEQSGPGVFGHRWHSLLDMQVVASDGNLSLLDETGRLRTYRPQPDGSWVSEKYDYEIIRKTADAGFVRSLKNGLVYQFDASARLSEIRDPNGRFIRISRSDTPGASVRLEDRIGRFITLELNGEGRATRAVDSAGRVCLYGYDDAGSLTTCQNRGGGVLQMRYDADHRLTQLDGGPLAYTIAYRDGRICRQETDRGRIASYVYAEQGDARTVAVTDAAGAETLHSFAKGGELTVTDPTGVKESIWLNDRDLPVKAIGADGRLVTIAYDDHANVIAVEDGGRRVQLAYGPDDTLREMQASTGESATLSYDGRRNVTMQEDARGARTRFTWDQQGQLVGVQGPAGEALALTYDDNGHVRTLTTADGQRVALDFTLVGILRSVTTPTGVQIGYRYDPLDRLTGVENSEGQQAHLVRDPWGQVIKVVDPEGNASTMEYDAAGLLTAVQDPLGAVTRLAYDPLGRPTALTDANANVTQWNYDAAGRVLGEVDALGKPRVARYNERGQLQAQTNRRGQTTTLTYDAQGRVVATDANGDPATFAYDQTGRLVGMKDGDSDYRLAFTADGLLRTVADGVADVPVSYEYDSVGRRVTMTAGKDVVHYAYDAFGRLSTIQGSVGKVAFEYDQFGRRSAMLYPNGVKTTYAYDKLNRLTELRAVGPDGKDIAHYQYAYDILGNRTRMTEGADQVTQYAYDTLSRLTTVTEGTNVTEYTYDGVGNRVAVMTGGVKEAYTTGKDNQLLKAGSAVFTYDADGNLVSRSTTNGTAYTYRYDAANRLIAAMGPSGAVAYGYAPNGARVSRAEAGQAATRYLFDQEDVIAELSGNTQVAAYLHGPGIDAPLAQRRGDATVLYQADGLGSITTLTDAKGDPAGRYTYDAFGQPRHAESAVANPYRYTGREWDGTAGAYFYRARFLSSDVGRFLSKDSLGLHEGVNQYAYVMNNPVLLVDPSGLSPFFGEDKNYSMASRFVDAGKLISGIAKDCIFDLKPGDVGNFWGYAEPMRDLKALSNLGVFTSTAQSAIDTIGMQNLFDGMVNAKDNVSWLFHDASRDEILDFITDANASVTAVSINALVSLIPGVKTVNTVWKMTHGKRIIDLRPDDVKNAANYYVKAVESFGDYWQGVGRGLSSSLGTAGPNGPTADSTTMYFLPVGSDGNGLIEPDLDGDGVPDGVDNDSGNTGTPDWANPSSPNYGNHFDHLAPSIQPNVQAAAAEGVSPRSEVGSTMNGFPMAVSTPSQVAGASDSSAESSHTALPAPEDDDSGSGDVPICVNPAWVPVKPSTPPPGRAGVQ